MLRWSMAGYSELDANFGNAMLLTPPSALRAISAGYQPLLHPSAV